MVGGHTGQAGRSRGGRAGAHVAGRARAVLPADSAEQAGTDSPALMCLLPRISSLSSGWERGREAASPISPGLGALGEAVGRQWGPSRASNRPCVSLTSFPTGPHLAGGEPGSASVNESSCPAPAPSPTPTPRGWFALCSNPRSAVGKAAQHGSGESELWGQTS